MKNFIRRLRRLFPFVFIFFNFIFTFKTRFHVYKSNNIKLHVGCGNRLLKGWVNTDYIPINPKKIHLDVSKPFPFFLPNEKATFIFSEHLIEHLEIREVYVFLNECYRVLKKNGVIRISTPNFNQIINCGTNLNYTNFQYKNFISHGPCTDVNVINNFFRAWGHKFIFDFQTLNLILIEIGFKDVKTVEILKSNHFELCNLENTKRLPDNFLEFESLIIEARKI